MTVPTDLLNQIPLFQDLHHEELVEIAGWFTETKIAAGESLYVEGDAATSASFLVDGELEALKALPGGGVTRVGVIAAGSMIGEMALVAGGTRSATVRALKPATVVVVSCYFFHAAIDQMSIPAFKLLRSVIHSLTRRLQDLHARVLEQWDCEAASPPSGGPAQSPAVVEHVDHVASFDCRPFLPVIPFFANFTESEIDRVLKRARMLELPRGDFVYREGDAPDTCYILVRGAVEISVLRDRRYQLEILGPGRLCGANSLISGMVRKSDARARSPALLLAFAAPRFMEVYLGEDTECLRFQNMVGANQLEELKIADNLLSTLVSQDQILAGARASNR